MIQQPRKPDRIPRLDGIRRGEGLSAAKATRTIDVINRLTQGTRPVRQIPPVPRGRPGTSIATTVVLTVEPVEADSSLTVRKVKYAAVPPVEGDYAWDGQAFTGFPDFGSIAFEYAEFFTAIETVPTLDTTFFQAFKQQDVWIIEMPSAGGGGETKDFMFVRSDERVDGGDYIICRLPETAGTNEGDETAVAKPWLLRRTPFDRVPVAERRVGIRYLYDTSWRREAFVDGETQFEVITPRYFNDAARDVGDIIHTEKRSTGLVDAAGDPIVWLEVPNQRAWAVENE